MGFLFSFEMKRGNDAGTRKGRLGVERVAMEEKAVSNLKMKNGNSVKA